MCLLDRPEITTTSSAAFHTMRIVTGDPQNNCLDINGHSVRSDYIFVLDYKTSACTLSVVRLFVCGNPLTVCRDY